MPVLLAGQAAPDLPPARVRCFLPGSATVLGCLYCNLLNCFDIERDWKVRAIDLGSFYCRIEYILGFPMEELLIEFGSERPEWLKRGLQHFEKSTNGHNTAEEVLVHVGLVASAWERLDTGLVTLLSRLVSQAHATNALNLGLALAMMGALSGSNMRSKFLKTVANEVFYFDTERKKIILDFLNAFDKCAEFRNDIMHSNCGHATSHGKKLGFLLMPNNYKMVKKGAFDADDFPSLPVFAGYNADQLRTVAEAISLLSDQLQRLEKVVFSSPKV